MINKVTMFIALAVLCVYALVGCQQPPGDYPDDESVVKEEVVTTKDGDENVDDSETERGYPRQSAQQPPRDYPDDNRDIADGDHDTEP
ncbi:MAG: hypothetical protein GY775_17600 [Candidatus Scalindua sp.]|nr:hypothetical protein [Candidatus Scalindua sp.]